AIFSRHTACYAAKTDVYLTQCTVVHIHYTLPGYTTRINVQFVAMMQMVVDECSQCIVSSCDGMKVPVEMEINFFHRQNLCVAADSSMHFYTHYRTACRFTECDHDILFKLSECIGQSDGTCLFPFPCCCRVHSGYQYHFGCRLIAFHLMYI